VSGRPRILRLVPELDFGGVESRIILQTLLHTRERFDLHVATFHKAGAAAEKVAAAGVPVYVVGERPSVRNPRATMKLARVLRSVAPDVVHASIVEANFHVLLAGLSIRGFRTIVEETGMPSHSILARAAFRALYRRADRIVGVSRAICDYLVTADGAPHDRVRLIYNCAAPDYFPSPPTPARRRDDGPLRVLAVGRLVPVKNHATLLTAVSRARAAGVDVELSIAGAGPLGSELEALARTLGIAASTRFLGFRSDVPALLAEADLFVLPSFSEGCSVSLVEAMAAGVPVLGSTAPGIREVVGDLSGECCVPADDADQWASRIAAIAAMTHDARAARIERQRRRAYEAFSPTVYIKHVEAQYTELASSDSPRAQLH
jgi:glycosyltransferase involved in cell wall biosynthesis